MLDSSSLDQELTLKKSDVEVLEFDTSMSQTNLLELAKNFIRASKLSGLGLAKVLYHLSLKWEGDTSFAESMFAELGLHIQTVLRYVKIWAAFEHGVIPKSFINKPMKDLAAISNLVSQGYEITQDDWTRLETSPDNHTTLNIIREIKGTDPRKSSMQIFIDADGNLSTLFNGSKKFLGYLDITNGEPKAIERIIESSGILR